MTSATWLLALVPLAAACAPASPPIGPEPRATNAPTAAASHAPIQVAQDPLQDTDKDGVPDAVDQCPTFAAPSPDGCAHHIVDARPEELREAAVHFAPNAFALSPDALHFIEEAADLLHQHPEMSLIHIIGNTDSTEPRGDELGRKRAQALADALVARGVERTRLSVETAGAKTPVAPSDSEENRARNRRIEFRVVQQ